MAGPHSANFEAHRPAAAGTRGMVVAGHPLAAEAGAHVLRTGGNAVDAAMAVTSTLGIVEPQMSGLGGDGFILIYRRDAGTVEVVNGTGPAPTRATLDEYRSGIPYKGIRSTSVPGLVDACLLAHARYGSRPLSDSFATAIELARDGYPLSWGVARTLAKDEAMLRTPSSAAIYAPQGVPLAAGAIVRQPALALTLEAIADGGRAEFYEGAIARAIAACSRDEGGLIDYEDLAAFHARWQPPISVGYRGYEVFEGPPNCSGHVLLQELAMVEQFDLAALGCNAAESVHLMVEAKRLAFADREAYLADPDWVDVPIEGLLSPGYTRERAALIDPARAAATVVAGDPWRHQASGRPAAAKRKVTEAREDTTCFVVVDRWGNAVCQLQSIQSAFGSSLIEPRTGILLNNRMTYWHTDPEHIDCLAPGKRVRHTMNPVMVFRDGHLVLVCGTPGADTQVQTNLQVISHVLDFGMSVNEAVEAPRWRHTQNPTESEYPHTCDDALLMEARFPAATVQALSARGHGCRTLGPWEASGSEVMIRVDPATGALFGGADPRRDAYAIGF